MIDDITPADIQIIGTSPKSTLWTPSIELVRIEMSPEKGFKFIARPIPPNRWDCFFDGISGDKLRYTVWPFVIVDGQWKGFACVQMWEDRESTGPFGQSTWREDFPANWGYIAGLGNYHPVPGMKMGFMLAAGNGRFHTDVTSVAERSNIRVITLPDNDRGSWDFEGIPGPVDPPVPDPDPTDPPAPQPPSDPLLIQIIQKLVDTNQELVGAVNNLATLQSATQSELALVKARQDRALSGKVWGSTTVFRPVL